MFAAKFWLCTLNNPTGLLSDLFTDNMDGLIGQLEKGENGTPHFQFLIQFKNKQRISAIKKIDKRIHAEVARDIKSSLAYVQKEDTRLEGPWSFGNININLGGGDRKSVTYAQQSALSVEDRKQLTPYQINQLAKAEQNMSIWENLTYAGPRQCFWLVGKPGVGKSYYVKMFKPYMKDQNKWWDSYGGQSDVLIDDFDQAGVCLSHFLKIWADPYGVVYGEVKGSRIPLSYTRLWITSNYSIDELFPNDSILLEALHRRFKTIMVYIDHWE